MKLVKMILNAALFYLLIPFLIYMYATTGIKAYMYALGTLCSCVFVLLLLFTVVMFISHAQMSNHDRITLRSKMREKHFMAMLHLAMGIAIAIAIFVYVNTSIGIVYSGSLFLLQLMRYRVKRLTFS